MGIGPSYFERRERAIKAWELEDYMLLEHIDKGYGLTPRYLYAKGLLEIKKVRVISPPSNPYTLSQWGKLYMTKDEEFSLLFVRPRAMDKLLFICIARAMLGRK